MAKKENFHPYYIGTEHGRLSFGEVRVSNEISACMLQSGPDGGRHYITMEETGDAKIGTKGSTKVYCPGTFTVRSGKDIENYPKKDPRVDAISDVGRAIAGEVGERVFGAVEELIDKDEKPRNIPAMWYEAENGDIIIKAPRGRIKLEAESIELTAKGFDGRTGNILMDADDKIALKAQIIDVNSRVSTKIFSESTVDMIGSGIMNIYGGLCDFADRTTKGSKPSKTCGGAKSINEERNK
tara:strand:- start:155 stop:874 length:720 start_codon:yes stop_codon:yes gene_type:complete